MSLSTLNTSLTSLLHRFQTTASTIRLPPTLSTFVSNTFAWRILFLILALINLKSLPWSWHIRLLFNMARHGTTTASIRRRLYTEASLLPSSSSESKPKPVHPIFRPLALHTHAPMGECDYNLHKSNSTYFSDLDLSRGGLVASLIGPALRLNALEPHGIRKGLCYPILGAVHTSFLREIKPYERYDARSRVLGWDRKWIVILSVFARKATPQEVAKDKSSGKDFLRRFGAVGEEEVVFAVVLNKYVIKAGRVTVPPELCLGGSGWFPVRPEATETIRRYNAATEAAKATGSKIDFSASMAGTGNVTPALGPEKVVADTANKVQNVALEAGRRLSMSGDKKPKVVDEEGSDSAPNNSEDDPMPGWTWDEIETERARGMKFAEEWLGLDGRLRKAYESDIEREIW